MSVIGSRFLLFRFSHCVCSNRLIFIGNVLYNNNINNNNVIMIMFPIDYFRIIDHDLVEESQILN